MRKNRNTRVLQERVLVLFLSVPVYRLSLSFSMTLTDGVRKHAPVNEQRIRVVFAVLYRILLSVPIRFAVVLAKRAATHTLLPLLCGNGTNVEAVVMVRCAFALFVWFVRGRFRAADMVAAAVVAAVACLLPCLPRCLLFLLALSLSTLHHPGVPSVCILAFAL